MAHPDRRADDDIEALAGRFLDLWQDNVRAWAVERDLLTPEDLKTILGADKAHD